MKKFYVFAFMVFLIAGCSGDKISEIENNTSNTKNISRGASSAYEEYKKIISQNVTEPNMGLTEKSYYSTSDKYENENDVRGFLNRILSFEKEITNPPGKRTITVLRQNKSQRDNSTCYYILLNETRDFGRDVDTHKHEFFSCFEGKAMISTKYKFNIRQRYEWERDDMDLTEKTAFIYGKGMVNVTELSSYVGRMGNAGYEFDVDGDHVADYKISRKLLINSDYNQSKYEKVCPNNSCGPFLTTQKSLNENTLTVYVKKGHNIFEKSETILISRENLTG